MLRHLPAIHGCALLTPLQSFDYQLEVPVSLQSGHPRGLNHLELPLSPQRQGPGSLNRHLESPIRAPRNNPIPFRTQVSSNKSSKSHDEFMASRQTQYTYLSPAEHREQDEWACNLLRKMGSCPKGAEYFRSALGYCCAANIHFISDEEITQWLTTGVGPRGKTSIRDDMNRFASFARFVQSGRHERFGSRYGGRYRR